MKYGLMITACLLLLACQSELQNTPLLELQPQHFQHRVQAEGELFAVNSISINAPQSRGPRLIAEIQAEYTQLQEGDLVVRFDPRQLQRDHRNADHALATVQAELAQQQIEQNSELGTIALSQALVSQEFGFADQFSIDDVQIRSRLEIIDSLQNKAYLGEKQNFFNWQELSFTDKAKGQQDLLELRQQQQQTLRQAASDGLEALEIRAPYEGILVLDADWRGQKAEVGGMVFPGQRIGSLPDLSLQHLKLFVIEHEASGLAAGQEVSFQLAAQPGQQFKGEVIQVSQVAQSRQRRDPRRYIEVTVAPEAQSELFLPGSRVKATILLNQVEQQLVVPLQAIFAERNQLYVWRQSGREFEKQTVEIGHKSLTHAEVVRGVNAGDRIALIDVGS
ncbi:efflux RND transporter periplasmic adaptor subunit [Alkalimonas collagenimarina]|uniref:Efflux RND transporter periplasmic adaptor subunit n=1 Tax=Alkalimonas collagenimarina TaxID=400390 RepID=A0ABT9GXJ7_9GAMM|nr:efflux RND transporter periplasmic adaptor subunit [Alkalimonas collagenimarina]MDP4535688.1 efflux RND transporter periplasmic adaptor subunit [Alkalimonas collagenimarina]